MMNRIELRRKRVSELKKMLGTNFAVSNFVPSVVSDQLVDVAFLYPVGTADPKRTRPFAKIIIEHKTGILLDYSNSFINDFMDSEKYPMDMKIDYSISKLSCVAEVKQVLYNVETLYDDVCDMFVKEELSNEDKLKLSSFMDNFYKSIPCETLEFYQALSPEFFGWINRLL